MFSKNIGCSLHDVSCTRLPDQVESVKPFAAHLTGVKFAFEVEVDLSLTLKTRNGFKELYVTPVPLSAS